MLEELNRRIRESENVEFREPDNKWWFDRETQRKHIFSIAVQLTTRHDLEPKEALETAEQLVQMFYERHVQPSTRIK